MAQNQITVILGQKGKGKSTLARALVRGQKRLFVTDGRSEYTDGIIFETYRALVLYFDLYSPEEIRAICRFDDPEEMEQLFSFIFRYRNCCLLAEEADDYAPPDKSASPAFLRLIKKGRHEGIDIVAVTRRHAEINILLRSQADSFISFHQSDPSDLAYCKDLGFDPEALRALPMFQYLTVNN